MTETERLIFYSDHTRAMQGTVGAKIKAILDQGCIEYAHEYIDTDEEHNSNRWAIYTCVYICKPIKQLNGKPYNKSTYVLQNHRQFGKSCSCCGWRTMLKRHESDPLNEEAPRCAHVAALYEFLKRQHKERREENMRQAMLIMFMEE